ncbi:XRE family transcriptional regulator [Candidatus Parcubacteria bacterium]|nr:MAG: XRE family transcriptional regulator [Candidatus Parcubacteria bacterium]
MIKAKFIEKLRIKNDLSKAEVANVIGVSRPTYMQIEKGARELTVSEASKLAKLFDIDLNDLLLSKESSRQVVIEKDNSDTKKSDIKIRIQEKDIEKFKQVFLYIISKVGAKPNVGQTVIYKLLYFIDFDFYEKYEKNLMGLRYIKNHYGPTPVEFKTVVDEMEREGDIERVKSKHFQYEQKKYLPVVAPDISALSAEEIKHIDEVIAKYSSKTAKELSDYSHSDTPWMIH